LTQQNRIGPCKLCEYFDYEGDGDPQDNSLARCVQEELVDFEVTVSGASSCNEFEPLDPGVRIPPESEVSDWRGAHKLSV
jgi:hypothetical protein